MIVIFPEGLIYKYLRTGKKALAEVFRKFGQHDNLMIIVMVTKVQSFYAQMYVADLGYKKMFLSTCSQDNVISVEDLQHAVQMVKGRGKQIKLVSDREADYPAAEELGASFILLNKKITNLKISTLITDISLLPNILGLS